MSSLEVCYEDNHLIAINKTCGVLVQGDSTGDIPLVELAKQYIKEKYGKPGEVFLGVVHRIDRPVSGVVLFARTSKALSRMNELFRSRDTEKTYWAITDQKPASPEGTLVHWLLKDEKKNRTTAYPRETPGALQSELSYRVIARQQGHFLLEVAPKTGRPHQIRVQLADMGCPILGDVKYGSTAITNPQSIALHARRLSFIHPVQKIPLTVEAIPPNQTWWRSFEGKK
jgi:23S rRNA pseudouridine1911/1915/1917 synthase